MAKLTIQTKTLDNWNSSETAPRLRARADREFIAIDGTNRPIVGGPEFYLEWNLTVGSRVDGTGHVIPTVTIPAIEIYSTRDAVGVSTRHWIFEFYDPLGNKIGNYRGFTSTQLPADFSGSTNPTWDSVYQYNHPQAPIHVDRDTLNRDQILAFINQTLGFGGTINKLVKFSTNGLVLADSSISDDGTTVSTAKRLTVTGASAFGSNGAYSSYIKAADFTVNSTDDSGHYATSTTLNWTPAIGGTGGVASASFQTTISGANTAGTVWGVLIASQSIVSSNITALIGQQTTTANFGTGSTGIVTGVKSNIVLFSGTVTDSYGFRDLTSIFSSSGAITNRYGAHLARPTGTGATTKAVNNYAAYIEDQAGIGTTLSYNLYSAGAAALSKFEGPLELGKAAVASGSLKFFGTTSGIVTVLPANAAGTWTLTLPASAGVPGQVLQTSSGVTNWVGLNNTNGVPVISGGTNIEVTSINTIGTDVDLYTVPAGKRAICIAFTRSNNTGLSIIAFLEVKISGVYYPIQTAITINTAQGGASVPAGTYVAEAGETFAINQGTNQGLNIWISFIEFPNTGPLKTIKVTSLASGNNTIYTAAQTVQVVNGPQVANFSGTTRTYKTYVVPTGLAADNTTIIVAAAGITIADKTQSAVSVSAPPGFANGTSLVLNTDAATATQFTWLTIFEPV